MITLDKPKATQMLRAKANSNPDNKAACYYVDGDFEPVCIVGHILVELKPEIAPVLNANNYRSIDHGSMLAILYGEGIKVTDGAARMLRTVQELQDSGDTWSEAVDSVMGGTLSD